jgi:WD40 repeat protein
LDAIVAWIKGPAPVLGASFLPNGRQVASWGGDKVLRIWGITPVLDAEGYLNTSTEVRNLDLGEDLKIGDGLGVVISPDGRLLLTAHGKTVRVRELATGKELYNFSVAAQEVRSLAFSPNSRYAAVGTSRSWVHLLRMPELPPTPKQ